jgi:hypothetical protein
MLAGAAQNLIALQRFRRATSAKYLRIGVK